MILRIEHRKDGVIVYLNGRKVMLPPVGQSIVVTPGRMEFNFRVEKNVQA